MPFPISNSSASASFNASEIGLLTELDHLPNFSLYPNYVQECWKALDDMRPIVSSTGKYCSVGVWVLLNSGPMLILGTINSSEIQSGNFQDLVRQEMIQAFPDIALKWEIPSESTEQFVASQLYKLHQSWQGNVDEFVSLFARWSCSVLGAGNYVFVNSNASVPAFHKSFSDIELTVFLDKVPVSQITYIGVVPPKLITEMRWRSASATVEHATPLYEVKPYEGSLPSEIQESANKLRAEFAGMIEPLIQQEYQARFDGNVLVFFKDSTWDGSPILNFLNSLRVVWYPSWHVPFHNNSCYVRTHDTGMTILELSGGRDTLAIHYPHMDESHTNFVENTVELMGLAMSVLADNLDRWAQRLPPDLSVDQPLGIDDTISAMNFLRRSMNRLSKNLSAPNMYGRSS